MSIFVCPVPDWSLEDEIKWAWAERNLPVLELERALETFWTDRVLPGWFAPVGMPTRGEIR